MATSWEARLFALGVVGTLVSIRPASASYTIERVAGGIALNQPTWVAQAPGDDRDLFIVERQGSGAQAGQLGDILKYDTVTHTASPFLDLTGTLTQDGGVYAVAFSPDFQSNGLLYVTSMVGATDHLDEYKVINGSPVLQRHVLQYTNFQTQHTIDWIGFQPGAIGPARNYLYVSTGDGGIQADQPNFQNRGQNASVVFGKVLRLDVTPGLDAYPNDPLKNFGIPADNPFVNDTTGKLKEVFETGHRNPWRTSFDRATGDLYVGDVGFNTKEEVDFNKNDSGFSSGRDYGWAKREGTIATPVAGVGGPSPGSINPIFEVNHPVFASITGGYVYRGPVSELVGKYFFGDFNSGKVYSLTFNRDTDPTTFNGLNAGVSNVTDMTATFDRLIGNPISGLVSFSEDNAGNLYLISFGTGNIFNPALGTGEIYEIVPEPGAVGVLSTFLLVPLTRRRKRVAL